MGGEILAGIVVTSWAAFLGTLGYLIRTARANQKANEAERRATAEHTAAKLDELVAGAAAMRLEHEAEAREYRRLLEQESREHRRSIREHTRGINRLAGDVESLEESHVLQGAEIRQLTRRMAEHDKFREQLYAWDRARSEDTPRPALPPAPAPE